MTRLVLAPGLTLALTLALIPAAPVAANTGCFTYSTGDRDGWGAVITQCVTVDRPRDPRPRKLR